MTKKIKLSSTQIFVIEMMQSGWELGHSKGFSTSTWIQKGGIGRGGDTKRISFATFDKLRTLKIIYVSKEGCPTDKYELSETGKTFKIN